MTGRSADAGTPLSLSPAIPSRWTPTRAGLVALWRYTDETFTFHHGRLLLRGPNGSGKSMALELLLPFLLDGDASPSRLTSSAKSRGGLYERVMGGVDEASRSGFAGWSSAAGPARSSPSAPGCGFLCHTEGRGHLLHHLADRGHRPPSD